MKKKVKAGNRMESKELRTSNDYFAYDDDFQNLYIQFLVLLNLSLKSNHGKRINKKEEFWKLEQEIKE